jgi:hypothetical protein
VFGGGLRDCGQCGGGGKGENEEGSGFLHGGDDLNRMLSDRPELSVVKCWGLVKSTIPAWLALVDDLAEGQPEYALVDARIQFARAPILDVPIDELQPRGGVVR